jgi:hypothetical protein
MADLNIDSILSLSDVRGLNDGVRGLVLDTGEKTDMAQAFGVGKRTVDRWFTLGSEQRNMVTRSVIGESIRTMDTAKAERVIAAQLLQGGVVQTRSGVAKLEFWQVRFGSVSEAARYLTDLAKGGIDPWLSQVWQRATLRLEGNDWVLRVEYRRDNASVPGS